MERELGQPQRQQHREQSGQQAQGSSEEEPAERHCAGAAVFVDQQAGDEEAADHEEQVDTQRSATQAEPASVIDDHGDDGDSP